MQIDVCGQNLKLFWENFVTRLSNGVKTEKCQYCGSKMIGSLLLNKFVFDSCVCALFNSILLVLGFY